MGFESPDHEVGTFLLARREIEANESQQGREYGPLKRTQTRLLTSSRHSRAGLTHFAATRLGGEFHSSTSKRCQLSTSSVWVTSYRANITSASPFRSFTAISSPALCAMCSALTSN